MREPEFGGPYVIEDDICDTLDFVVPGYCHDRDRERKAPGRVDRDDAIDRPLDEQAGIFVDQVGSVTVADDKIEISLLQEKSSTPLITEAE